MKLLNYLGLVSFYFLNLRNTDNRTGHRKQCLLAFELDACGMTDRVPQQFKLNSRYTIKVKIRGLQLRSRQINVCVGLGEETYLPQFTLPLVYLAKWI